MKHFFVMTNAWKDVGLAYTHRIVNYIRKAGGSCDYFITVDGNGREVTTEPVIPENVEVVLVLGGDGTLIHVARSLVERHIPLIGVNLGQLGYLCELEEQSVENAMDALMADQYTVEERMMLGGYMVQGQFETGEKLALNDIVIHRVGPLQIVNLKVYVNGEYLYSFAADGIILATPTGSTGYNMSAGGPIVDPKARLILMTPINSHTLNSKSIVIGADDEVVIEIGMRREERDEQVEVSFDGDNSMRLEVGDRIVVHCAQASTAILRLNKMSFLEILRKKMQNYT
ncbi:MAG: NAD(+)/NADH kinase [Lachnospiraceae bacterium]|nr:NAD(+)/NADH kinase [Lachnospiraceae bacterium]